jgi:hypothetical protein
MWPLACGDCGFESFRGIVHSVCCQVEFSASDCSLVQRIPADFDREDSTLRMPWSPKDCRAIEENCVDT